MKLVSDELSKFKKNLQTSPKIVQYIASYKGLLPLPNPMMSNEVECPFCGCTFGYATFVDPNLPTAGKVWICADSCASSLLPNDEVATPTLLNKKRAIEWPVFCEISDIGDLNYDVQFENIHQSDAKIAHMLKFTSAPKGFIFMQGDPGTGKTYAAMAICELFTRTSSNCIFITQHKLLKKWLHCKNDPLDNFLSCIFNTNLLVIDDFGTGEPDSKFLEFFMDLINTRMQWSNRGTVITTNLDDSKFSIFCGQALVDRINTGQKFEFKDKTRRKKMIL